MKKQDAIEKLKAISEEFKKDNDVFCLVHFSREDDEYFGFDNMDFGDTLIVIKELIKRHNLRSEVIAAMNIYPVS